MKMKCKRVLICLLTVLTVLGGIPVTAGAAQYSIQKNTYLDVRSTPTGKTGQNITMNMVFTNDGSEDLHDVSIRLDDDAAEEEYNAEFDTEDGETYSGAVFPFEITSSTFDPKKLGTVRAGSSRNVSLTARVRRDISEGYYAVPILISINGTDYRPESINIWITKSTDTTESEEDSGTIHFELGENQSTPTGAYPDVMNFTINLRNSSDISAFDVNARMVLSEDSTKFPFEINDGNYNRHYDRIGGGETVQIPYSMAIREDTYTGYYPITFNIEYRDSSEGEIQTSEETFYVRVINKEKEEESGEFNANDRTRARIIVDSFRTEPETVYAGEEFELILTMKNASQDVPASNLLFTLESEKVSESAVFTTDAGSSSFVVNSLGAGQSTELRVRMIAGAGVDQRTYAITINEKYDSPEYKNAEEKVTVDIPVRQVSRLNTGTIEVMPESISVGSETNVMFSINNTGKVQLYNVMVTFQSDSIEESKDNYVGNIKPGETGNVDVMLTGVAPTMDDGKVKILITYEDENGVASQPIEKEMTLMVTEAMEQDFDMSGMDIPVDAEPEQTVFQKFLIPGAVGAAVVILVLAVVVVKRRKKKKAALEEDMDDEI
ncbi:MAG TPA: hypothetical protein H9740_06360 [Candidatus Hungatella pullicola]|nr:hypothetical protein [Candidatus Hungatella pullicola]